jgi:glycosyltransferase involved in cell wall biosynthesis
VSDPGADDGRSLTARPSREVGKTAAISPIIVAYSASARTNNSVPRIGYQVSKGISDRSNATLIVHSNERDGVSGQFSPTQLRFAGSARLARNLRRLSQRLFPENWNLITVIEFVDYFLFDLHAYFIARRIVRRQGADCVLRVNPVSLLFPSLLARLPVPVFSGPHNGGMDWPPGFAFLESEEPTGHQFRVLGKVLHRLYSDIARYRLIFAATESCRSQSVPAEQHHKVMLVAENGIDSLKPLAPRSGDARHLLFVGRLIRTKGVEFIIKALTRLPQEVELTVAGDGPYRSELERLAGELGVAHRCHFLGPVPHERLDEVYQAAGVFVFPSLRDSGGAVVLEAMSHGLPCVVAAWGGPETYTRTSGVQVSVESPSALEDDLVSKLWHMLQTPEESRALGERGQDVVVRQYLWEAKADHLYSAMANAVGPGGAMAPERVLSLCTDTSHEVLS